MDTETSRIASGYGSLLDVIPQCIAFQFETVLAELSADGRLWFSDAEGF
jgi:hypothetical protein